MRRSVGPFIKLGEGVPHVGSDVDESFHAGIENGPLG
jgi:hypothetical protein